MTALVPYELMFWRQNSGAMQDKFGRLVKFSSIDGLPDICGFGGKYGRFFGIEVKSTSGRQRDKQKIFQKQCECMGGIYMMPREGMVTAADVAKQLWELLNR
jgi:hypothetical protein